MTIKRDLLKVDLQFLEEETYAKNGMYAIEHRLYNVDGVMGWDTHRLSQEDIDEEEKKQVFLLSVVYNDDDTGGEDISSILDSKLFNEEGMTKWSINCVKSDELDATITEEERKQYE